ncbi:hypothetical protein IGI04_010182 [Brassica rapa subsp. trilocularis]|uniref:Uncharacterized protein n=1 Tax=Brassica rapa subsp. trilocularis TaxID=1813537 RepID=A0ABQ7MZF8_BRACM|nr:hypothetical protein IGI04_010182 [Brassica rapa subsp. trilocularis]
MLNVILPMLHGNGSGYVEAEANVLEARFRKLSQGSDSDSDSEAGSGRPMKLPCNVGFYKLKKYFLRLSVYVNL